MNNKGLTLIEVLLSLFILIMVVLVFNRYTYVLHRFLLIDTDNQAIGELAKNKMEELKSSRIYIDGKENSILGLQNEEISFIEDDYTVDIFIKPLDNSSINYVNVKVTNKKDDSFNLIRYVNFYGNNLPNIYEELNIDPD